MHQSILEVDPLESSFAEKALRVWMDARASNAFL